MAETIPMLRLGALTYHLPFAHLIRPHTAQERAELEASVRAHARILVRVVTYDSPTWGERCVIDGIGRLTVAAALGYDVPVQHRGRLPDGEARDECLALNLDRRQLTPEEQQAARAGRVVRVAAAREQGLSTREIARAEGVSQMQIVRDLAKATGLSSETPVSHDGLSDTLRPLVVLERSLGKIVRLTRASKSVPAQPAGALPDLLSGPLRASLERIAARHGVPLEGDRWPLVESLVAVVSDLVAEAAQQTE